MAKVIFNILSQSSNKKEAASDKQSSAENDMLEQNKSDEQQITIKAKIVKRMEWGLSKKKEAQSYKMMMRKKTAARMS